MTVITSLSAGLSRTLTNQNARVASSLQTLVSGSAAAPADPGVDVSGLAAGSNVPNPVVALRATSQNIAQANALADVANKGVHAINDALTQLQQLSVQAVSGTLTDADRQALNSEFQSVRQEIDQVANNTSFAGQSLLNGSQSSTGATTDGNQNLSVGSLTDQSLFGGADVNLLTSDQAQAASVAVTSAQQYVAAQIGTIGAFSEGLQFAAASVDSALQNQQASTSTLSEADFAPATNESAAAQVQTQAPTALLAQTNRLSPSMLTLLVE